MLPIVYSAGDVISVDAIFDVVVVVRRNNIINKICLNVVDEGRVKSIFHVPRTRWRGDEIVERMRWTEGARQVLSRQELEMVGDREHLSLGVQMLFRSQFHTA